MLSVEPNVEKTPFLKLRARVAERHGYGLKFVGGRHRHQAMQIKQDESRQLVTKIQDKLADVQDMLKDGKGGQKSQKTLQQKIDGIEQELEEEMELEKNVSVWGVVLYDESKWDY